LQLIEIYNTINEGAQSFLWAEYKICFIFIALFGTLILVLTSRVSNSSGEGEWKWNIGAYTATSFVIGGLTSILSGYIGEFSVPAHMCGGGTLRGGWQF
jgi:Na+/H+-translocating membrane pyrophosphatase